MPHTKGNTSRRGSPGGLFLILGGIAAAFMLGGGGSASNSSGSMQNMTGSPTPTFTTGDITVYNTQGQLLGFQVPGSSRIYPF